MITAKCGCGLEFELDEYDKKDRNDGKCPKCGCGYFWELVDADEAPYVLFISAQGKQPTPYPSDIELALIRLKKIDVEILRLEEEKERVSRRLHILRLDKLGNEILSKSS